MQSDTDKMDEVIVFDNDGVLIDSAWEGLAVAINVLRDTSGDQRIFSRDALQMEFPYCTQAILENRSYMTETEQNLTLGHLVLTETSIDKLIDFYHETHFFKERALSRYCRDYATLVDEFTDCRKELLDDHPQEFYELVTPYEGMLAAFKRAQEIGLVYVSSAKAEAYDHMLRVGFDISQDMVYTSDHGSKTEHIKSIQGITNIPFSRITMIEDSFPETCKLLYEKLGFNLLFLNGGYNTPDQQNLVARLGAEVIDREELCSRLEQGTLVYD